MAVHELLRDRGGIPEGGELEFSFYELLGWLGWTDGGGNYSVLKSSLSRIAATTIECDKAFWSARAQRYVTDTFSVWSFHRQHYRNTTVGGGTERHLLRLHPLFVENYMDNHLSELDSGFYWSLGDPMAKRLYRLLESYSLGEVGGGGVWECDLFQLRDLVPLAGYESAGRIKQALARANQLLMACGYLSEVSFEKVRKGEHVVRYEISEDFPRRRMESAIEAAPENQAALEAMKTAGIPRAVRIEELKNYEPDVCLEFASLLPHQRNLQSPVAAFRWALRNPDKGRKWWDSVPETRRAYTVPDQIDFIEGHPYQDHCVEHVNIEQQRVSTELDIEADRVWQAVLEDVAGETNGPSLRVWFEGAVPVTLSDNTLTLSVPNSSAREYIESRFGDSLEKALQRHLSPTAELEIVVGAECSTNNTTRTDS